jgi:hypothetical protein
VKRTGDGSIRPIPQLGHERRERMSSAFVGCFRNTLATPDFDPDFDPGARRSAAIGVPHPIDPSNCE